jgi:hypothetical protein
MRDYDIYLAHASENEPFASELCSELERSGLRVWFNSFIVGPSIREQMEHGLGNSEFGVVVLSPEFFEKKWTTRELDALFGLESPGEIRILPVWHNVSEDFVRERSSMLAMRSASVFRGSIADVARDLVKSILILSAAHAPASRLRYKIATGFPWTVGPVFLAKSLAIFDTDFSKDYAFTALAYFPSVHGLSMGKPMPLQEFLRSSSLWDGERLTIIGTQVAGSVQVFEQVARDEDLPPDIDRPVGAGLASYVFQLHSVDFIHGELCYVFGIGAYSRAELGWGPNAPRDYDSLCWVTGLPVAYGSMKNAAGVSVNAVYFTASSIAFMPKVQHAESE